MCRSIGTAVCQLEQHGIDDVQSEKKKSKLSIIADMSKLIISS